MPDKDASTPRVFLIRHGETEWSQSGQYTGKSDIPLTANGEAQVASTASIAVGSGRLIDPAKLGKVWVSPRSRAQKTFEILFGEQVVELKGQGKLEITEELAEWDYGEYEGLLTKQIKEKRAEQGLDKEKPWDIWRDGCAPGGGESAQQVSDRIDGLIAKIRELQGPHMKDAVNVDVVLVAHGHLTRAFAKRWLGYPLDHNLNLMMEPGGVGILSYSHHNVEEPALLLGIGFPSQ